MLPWDGDIVFYMASPETWLAASLAHPNTCVCGATERSGLLAVSSWRAFVSFEMFERSTKQGRAFGCFGLVGPKFPLDQSCQCDA